MAVRFKAREIAERRGFNISTHQDFKGLLITRQVALRQQAIQAWPGEGFLFVRAFPLVASSLACSLP